MAVRFDAETDGLTSATVPGSAWTATCWVWISVDTDYYQPILGLYNGTSVYRYLSTDTDGVTMKFFGQATNATGPVMSVGAWYRLGVIVNGSTVTLRHGAATGGLTSAAGTCTTGAVTALWIGRSTFSGEWFNGRIAALKMWNAALSVAEVDAEFDQYAPVRATNLHRYHPFVTSPGTTDESGNGNTLTAGSTATTTEAGPSIPDVLATGTVSFVAVNNAAGQTAGTTTTATTTSVTPTLPTGTASGDRVYVIQTGSNTTAAAPANWTNLALNVQVGPTGTAPGSSLGRRLVSVHYRDYDGVWTMPAFTLTSAAQNSHAVGAVTLRKTTPSDYWAAPQVTTAGNTSAATTAYSVTTGSLTSRTGAMLLTATARNDVVTGSAQTLTGAGGQTFASIVERIDGGIATGNDVTVSAGTAIVTAGGTGTISGTATLSAASEGGSIVIEQTATPSASVRFDAANDYYFSTAGVTATAPFTLAFWAYIAVNRATYSGMVCLDNTSALSFDIETGSNGLTTIVFHNTTERAGPALTVGAWYKIAAVVSGTAVTLYTATEFTALASTAAGTFATFTPLTFDIGALRRNAATEWFNGRICGVKFWTAALNTTELAAEFTQYAPARTANLQRAYLFYSGPSTTDDSGNGRTLTANGTITAEGGPVIPYSLAAPAEPLPLAPVLVTDAAIIRAATY